MNKKLFVRLSSSLLFASLSIAQADEAADQPAEAVEINAKAAKYHKVLSKRPNSGHVFDRFCDAWLDTHSNQQLEAYLIEAANDKSPASQLLLAYFYQRQGEDHKALEVLKKSLVDHPENQAIRIQQAKTLAKLLAFDAAVAELDIAAKTAEHDDKLEILQLRGKFLARCGRYEEAQQTWTEILKTDASDEELVENILEAQIAEGLFEQALATSDIQLKQTRDAYQKVLHTLRRGDIYQRSGDVQKAIDTYTSTLDSVGEGSWLEREILAQLHEIFRRDDDFESLVTLYEKLTSEHPQRVGIKKAHTQLLSQLERHDEAETLLREILKITPGDRSNREGLIEILLNAEKFDAALVEIKSLIELHPEDAQLWLTLARVQQQAGQKAELEASLQEYIKLNDSSENAYLTAAELLRQYKLPESADKLLVVAIEKFPASLECRDTHARLLLSMDRRDEAIAIWTEMIESGTRDTVMRQTQTLRTAGEAKLSYELLQKRADEFNTDINFATYVTNQALSQKDYEYATTWANTVLALSSHIDEMRQAVLLNCKVAMRAQDLTERIDQLKQLENPSIAQHWLLSQLYELDGETEASLAEVQKIHQQDEITGILAETDLYENREDYTNAAKSLETILEKPNGKRPIYLRRLVTLYRQLDEREKALAHIETWKQLAPGEQGPWLLEADLHMYRVGWEKSIVVLQRASQKFSDDNHAILMKLAEIYQRDSQYAQAQRIYWNMYERSEEMDDRLKLVQDIAKVAEEQGRMDDLIATFQEKRSGNRKSVEPLLALAAIYQFNEDYEERRKAMLEAAQLKPNDVKILHSIAQLEEREGDIDRAENTLQRAIKIDKSESSKQKLAELYLKNEEGEKGLAILQELHGVQSADARELEKATLAIANSNEIEAALTFIDDALLRFPNDYRLSFLKAQLLYYESDYDDTIEQLLGTLQINEEIENATAIQEEEYWKRWLGDHTNPITATDNTNFDWRAYHIMPNKQNRRGRIFDGQLPGHLFEKNGLSVGAILSCIARLDDSEKASWISKLEQQGFKEVEFRSLIAYRYLANSLENDELQKFLELNPEHTGAMVKWLQKQDSSFEYGKRIQNAAEIDIKKCFEYYGIVSIDDKHKDDLKSFEHEWRWMQLYYSDDKDSLEKWQQTLQEHQDHINNEVKEDKKVTQLAPPYHLMNKDVQEDIRDLLITEILKDFAHEENYQHLTNWHDELLLLGHCAQPGREKLLADYMVQTTKVYQHFLANRKSNQYYPWKYQIMTGYREAFIALPAYPPKSGSKVPPHLWILADEKLLADNVSNIGGKKPTLLSDLEIEFPAEVEIEPQLQLLLASSQGNEELEQKIIAEIEQNHQWELGDIMLLVGYYAKQEQYDKAMQLLQKARYQPLKSDQRKKIDGNMVALGLKMIDDGEYEDGAELIEAKRAALRLRKSRFEQSDDKKQLITLLDHFGLHREADQFAAKNQQQQNNYSSAQTMNYEQEFIDAVRDGKEDKIKRLANKRFKALIRDSIKHSTMKDRKAFRELVKENQLEEHLTKSITAGESSSKRKQADYAIGLFILAKNDEAYQKMSSLVRTGSKDHELLANWLFLIKDEDIELAGEIVHKRLQFSSYWQLAQLLDLLLRASSEGDTHHQFFRLLTIYKNYFDSTDGKNNQGQRELIYAYENLNRQLFYNSRKWQYDLLSPLADDYIEKLEKCKNDEEREINLQYQSVLIDLLLATMKQPVLAEASFNALHAMHANTGTLDQLNREVALPALLNHFKALKNADSVASNSYLRGKAQSLMQLPLAFLIDEAQENGGPIVSSDELSQIKKVNAKAAAFIGQLDGLLNAEASELEAMLQTIISNKDNKKIAGLSGIMLKICAEKSHLSPAVNDYLVRSDRANVKSKYDGDYSSLLQNLASYFPLLADHLSESELESWLNQLAHSLAMCQTDLAAYLRSDNSSYSQGQVSHYERKAAFLKLMAKLNEDTSGYYNFSILRVLLDTGQPLEYSVRKISSSFNTDSIKTADDLVEDIGLHQITNLSTAKYLAIAQEKDEKTNPLESYIVKLRKKIRRNDKGEGIQVKDLLAAAEGKSAETQFIVRALCLTEFDNHEKKQAALLPVLENHADIFAQMDSVVGLWAYHFLIRDGLGLSGNDTLEIPASYSDKAKKVIHQLVELGKTEAKDKIAQMLLYNKVDDDDELKGHISDLQNYTNQLAESDRELLSKTAGHLLKLSRDYQNAREKDNYYHPLLGSHHNNQYTNDMRELVSSYPASQAGDRIKYLRDILQTDPLKGNKLSFSDTAAAAAEVKTIYTVIFDQNKTDDERLDQLAQLIADYSALPAELQSTMILSMVRTFLYDTKGSFDFQLKTIAKLKELAKESDSAVNTAITASVLCKNIEFMPANWGQDAVEYVKQTYQLLDSPEEKFILTHNLASDGGEIFNHAQIAQLAIASVVDSLAGFDYGDQFYAYESLHNILLNYRPSEKDERYAQLYKQLKKELRLQRKSSSVRSNYRNSKSYYSLQQSLLALALASGDENLVNEAIKSHTGYYRNNPYVTMLLLRHGQAEEAHKLWSINSKKELVLDVLKSPIGLYDAQLEAGLDGFVALKPNDKQRQLLRDLVSLRGDSIDPAQQPKQDDKQRRVKLAENLLDSSHYNADEACKLISNMFYAYEFEKTSKELDGDLYDALQPAIPQLMEKLLVQVKYDFNEKWKDDYFTVIALYFKKLAEDENLEQISKDLKAMNAAAKANNNRPCITPLYAAAAQLQTGVYDAILSDDKEKLADYQKLLEPFARTVLSSRSYSVYRNYSLPSTLYLLCYLFSDQPSAYTAFRDEMEKHKDSNTKYLRGFYQLMPLAHASYNGHKLLAEENRELHVKIFKKLIDGVSDDLFEIHYMSVNGYTGLNFYLTKKLLPKESLLELYDYGHSVDKNPNGDAMINKAKVYKDFGEHKKAEACFREGVKLAEAAGDNEQLGSHMYFVAESMYYQKRYQEAVDYARVIPEDLWNQFMKDSLYKNTESWLQEAKGANN